jgi:predicted RNA-binding protein
MARLYETKEGDKPILEDIARVTIADQRVEAETLLGERKVFQGRIRQIDFVKSRIQLELQED